MPSDPRVRRGALPPPRRTQRVGSLPEVADARPPLRLQIGVLVVAALIAAGGAVVWSRTIADGGDDIVRLDTPGDYVDPVNSNPANAGASLPRVTLTDASGAEVELWPNGRPMVVNLWYSTCPPCARELTYFAAVHEELGDDVRFVGVDSLDDAETMVSFAAERGVEYELLLDHDDVLGNALRVVQMPVTLFVAADGTIVDQTGALTEAELREGAAELVT